MTLLLKLFIGLRWAYFHVHPSYKKFYFDADDKDGMFQNIKDGSLHAQLKIEVKHDHD